MIMAVAVPPMIVVLPVLINRVYAEWSEWSSFARRVRIAASRSRYVDRLWLKAGYLLGRYAEDANDVDWHQDRDVWHHVVIAGNILGGGDTGTWRQLAVMLEHCFLSDDDRLATQYLQMVILSLYDPPKAFQACVLDHPHYQTRVGWVTGSAFEPMHVVDWARATTAIAVVVVGDANASRRGRQLEDDRTVRQAVAIKRILERACGAKYRPYSFHSNRPGDVMTPSLCYRKIKVVAGLFYERNFYRLEDEARSGCVVVCLDEIKLALLARSIVVPSVHKLITYLVSKRPLHHLIVDKSKLRAFGDLSPSRGNRSISIALSQFNQEGRPSRSMSVRGFLSLASSDEEVEDDEQEEKRKSSRREGEKLSSHVARPLTARPVPTPQSVRGRRRCGPNPEDVELELSMSSNIFEVPVFNEMVGVRFSDLAEEAHNIVVKAHARFARDYGNPSQDEEYDPRIAARVAKLRVRHHHHRHESILGALPVAVVTCSVNLASFDASAHASELDADSRQHSLKITDDARRVVVNFPHSYFLRRDDSLLVIARCRRDADAILCFIDYDALRLKARFADTGPRAPVVEANNHHRLPLDDEARHAMAAVARVGRLPAVKRACYVEAWIRRHVCCEVPQSLEGHVVFCGGVDEAQYFLQPLMYGLPTGNTPRDKTRHEPNDGHAVLRASRPPVVILDHVHYPDMLEQECDLENGSPVVSQRYKNLLEQLIFYSPLPERSFDSIAGNHPRMPDPLPQLDQRLWVVLGSPLERPRRYLSSRFPSALERAGAERCAHFILPRAAADNDSGDDDTDDIALDDDFNVKVARNLQLVIPRVPRPGRPSPHMLVEVLDPKRSQEFLDLHVDEGDCGPYGDGSTSSATQRIEMFSDRLMQSASIVAGVDSENIIDFIKHALCAWRSDGSLLAVALADGREYDSSTIDLIEIPPIFIGKAYSRFLSHVVQENRALPIALYRCSAKAATAVEDVNFDPHVDQTYYDQTRNDNRASQTVGTRALEESAASSRRHRHQHSTISSMQRKTFISVVQEAVRLSSAQPPPTGLRPVGGNENALLVDPFYVYINPLPGDTIQSGDKAFVLANSRSVF